MAKSPLIASIPDWETYLKHPIPLTPQPKMLVRPVSAQQAAAALDHPIVGEDEQTALLREIRSYLKHLVTKGYYIDFPPSHVRQSLYSSWINYATTGGLIFSSAGTFQDITAFHVFCDIQFMAALTDSAGIQGGVPIQCEPYELFGFVNFEIFINDLSPFTSSYTYSEEGTGTALHRSGWGILSKNYNMVDYIQPFYVKPGDVFKIAFNQIQTPLRTVAKVGCFVKYLTIDKIFLQDTGILRL